MAIPESVKRIFREFGELGGRPITNDSDRSRRRREAYAMSKAVLLADRKRQSAKIKAALPKELATWRDCK